MGDINRLKNILKAKNVSYIELSKNTKIPLSTIKGIIKRGAENSNIKNLQKICDFLNIEIDAILKDPVTFTNKPSTIVVIGRGGEKEEYEIPDEELDFAKQFIEKMSKKK